MKRSSFPLILAILVGYILYSVLIMPTARAGRLNRAQNLALQYILGDSIPQRDSIPTDSLVSPLSSQMGDTALYNQREVLLRDSIQSDSIPNDSIPKDSIIQDSLNISQLKAPVDFETQDSLVFLTKRNLVRLYGSGKVGYQKQTLEGDFMQLQTDSGTVFSTYIDYPDSLNKERVYARIKTTEEEYEAKSINYDFHSQRGYITDVITEQGEGYVQAKKTKRLESQALNLQSARYTTCTNHEHPHFYIAMTKAKVRPGKDLVAGPLYLVVADVPLPIALPFAFFPFTTTRSSGLIMPTYGDEMERGFYLRNGGYYFAINDYVDLELTGDIYTKGSWGVRGRSTYRKRYRYSGSLDASYLVTIRGDKVAGDFAKNTDFRIAWSHQQDSKANPYRTFSANVNYSTSSYNHNNLDGLYNQAVMGQNTKSSSISFSQRFPESPWSISGSMDITQRSRDKTVALTLPNLSITMSRIYPFKRKEQLGKERWYEKISLSYSGQLRNSVETTEDKLFKTNFLRDWKNSMTHSIPVSASFDIGQYLKVTPSFSYNEKWVMSKVQKAYDPALNQVVVADTLYGFNRIYDYNASLSLSTTLYGFWKPLPFLGDKINMIRHRMEPSISINYRPDFGAPRYGYWEELNYITPEGREVHEMYSPFEQHGAPGRGKSGSIGFSLANNLEAKIKQKTDSVSGESEFKKISLIESLQLSTSYNLAADSFQWSDLSASISLRLSQAFTLRLGGAFDLYTYDYHEHDGRISPYRVNKLRVLNGKGIGRFRGTSTSFSYTLNPQNLDKILTALRLKKSDKNKEGEKDGTNSNSSPNGGIGDPGGLGGGNTGGGANSLMHQGDDELGTFDQYGYLENKMDWSLGFNYNLSLGQGEFKPEIKEYGYQWRHDLSFNGSFSPTKNWKFNLSANYNFEEKKITSMTCNLTRDLHCWSMTASFIPIGLYKSYHFTIGVKSSLLQDLKYQQSSQPNRGGYTWY